MKSIIKTAIAVLCLFSMTFGLFACGETPDSSSTDAGNGNVDYSVTVSCYDSSTLQTISVTVKDASGNVVVSSQRLDSNNSASFSLKPATYTVELSGLLDLFDVPETILTSTSRNATIELVKKGSTNPNQKIQYQVILKMPNGRVVANKTVQLCTSAADGGACYTSVTNDEGVAIFQLAPATYEVHVNEADWPENCYFDNSMYKVDASDPKIEARFASALDYSVTVNYSATKDDDGNNVAERPAQGIEVSLFFYDELTMTVAETPTATATTDENGIAHLQATSSLYKVVLTNVPANYAYQTGLCIEGAEPNLTLLLTERGLDHSCPIMITEGEIQLNISKRTEELWYRLDHKGKAGVYAVETLGNLDTYAKYYEGSAGSIILNNAMDGENAKENKSETDKNCYLEISIAPEYTNENNWFLVKIGVKQLAKVPEDNIITIKVTFLRTIAETNIRTIQVNAEEIRTSFPAPTGTLTWLTPGDTVVYSPTDRYYHLGTAKGPIIYVPVSGTTYTARTFDTDFYSAYQNAGGMGFSFSDGKTYRYEYGDFLAKYSQSGNEQGLHPLTTELKTFFQSYAELNRNTNELGWNYGSVSNPNPDLYMFACFYFVAE